MGSSETRLPVRRGRHGGGDEIAFIFVLFLMPQLTAPVQRLPMGAIRPEAAPDRSRVWASGISIFVCCCLLIHAGCGRRGCRAGFVSACTTIATTMIMKRSLLL